MFQQQDWLMRQIQVLVALIAQLIFHRSTISYEIKDEDRHTLADQLHQKLLELIDSGMLREAEQLLLGSLIPDDRQQLLLAVDFYQRLNELDDGQLEECGFSREEIDNGLHKALEVCGVHLPGF